ncbi:hypothetical protein C7M84_000771 [Penaeus vannamei]|uniref:Uncharacterized protein n=1 Tax=Penaeus vannamei TaxID=6689 RepID=A0A3R7MFR9_PENVA|nr:hypothetical protein C7M84_000771 [Penaeus vannamei]
MGVDQKPLISLARRTVRPGVKSTADYEARQGKELPLGQRRAFAEGSRARRRKELPLGSRERFAEGHHELGGEKELPLGLEGRFAEGHHEARGERNCRGVQKGGSRGTYDEAAGVQKGVPEGHTEATVETRTCRWGPRRAVSDDGITRGFDYGIKNCRVGARRRKNCAVGSEGRFAEGHHRGRRRKELAWGSGRAVRRGIITRLGGERNCRWVQRAVRRGDITRLGGERNCRWGQKGGFAEGHHEARRRKELPLRVERAVRRGTSTRLGRERNCRWGSRGRFAEGHHELGGERNCRWGRGGRFAEGHHEARRRKELPLGFRRAVRRGTSRGSEEKGTAAGVEEGGSLRDITRLGGERNCRWGSEGRFVQMDYLFTRLEEKELEFEFSPGFSRGLG